MTVGDDKRTVRRLFDEVWNERRLEPIEELYARPGTRRSAAA
jgi:hypothetical protein